MVEWSRKVDAYGQTQSKYHLYIISYSGKTTGIPPEAEKETMKSPITGKTMKLTREKRTVSYRKEPFDIVFHCYTCEDSGETFTTTALDELNMLQVHSLYRSKHRLPFPEDIKRIRDKYGLPATKMSEILGLGINTYRNYEAGEMPALSNARLIQLADDEEEFIKLIGLCDTISPSARETIIQKAQKRLFENQSRIGERYITEYIFGKSPGDQFSGFTRPDLEKITEMVVFFSDRLKPWKTALNKLLFYSDFATFNQSVRSISGLRYRAIMLGPVPENYDSLYEYIRNRGDVAIENQLFPDGQIGEHLFPDSQIGEQFVPIKNRPFNPDHFTSTELSVMEKVCDHFKNKTAKEMVDLSHCEKAWASNHQNSSMIDYSYAFELKGLPGL